MRAIKDLRRRLCTRPHACCIQIDSIKGLISPLSKEGSQERILGDRLQKTRLGAKVSCVEDRALGTLYEVPIRK